MISLLVCTWTALALALPPIQDANAAPPADASSAPAEQPAPPRDLVSVAKAEAVRERAQVEAQVATIVGDLRKSADATLGFVQSRIDELAALGAAAVEPTLAVMNHADADPGSVNAGINAARAIAKQNAPAVSARLHDIGANGTRFGRRNAILALGLLGDASSLEFMKERLADPEPEVVREAVVALGRVGGGASEPLLVPFLQSASVDLVAATIAALAEAGATTAAADVIARMSKELAAEKPDEGLLRAGVAYLETQPRADGIALLEQVLRGSNTEPGLRTRAVAALMAVARADAESKKEVLRALRDAIKLLPRTPMRDAAKGMNELGDDSGVKIVTEDLDRQIEKNGSNVSARYKRAELYLDFGKWKEANRDLKEAGKVDRNPADPDWVNLALARSYAGMGRYSDASRHVQRLEKNDVTQLPGLYPEFQPMLQDSRYEKAFAAGADR